uniref:Proteasome adapter and scaffold protein ECM29 HEAT-repeat domain-containing protein n=1 Tax=Peronospora matthiolae TaxID=2874970 RepID=A0AAV1TBE7_9STRA
MDAELEASDASCLLEFRQGVYGSMSILASRSPTIVATSEQAFQVLLVRCFVEEEYRTGAGAHALKAFTSLAGAYAVGSTLEVRVKVIQELVAILKSSKLYDSGKNYARVRRAVATWCAELLIASVPEQYDVALRLSVMRLDALDDEDTRRSINKALFSGPLPSAAALVQTLRATFIQKDLKTSMHDRAAESCVRFCVEVLKASQDSSSQIERSCVVEYITHTLFGRSEQSNSAAVRSSLIFETAATALMELCEFDAKSVSAVLSNYANDLFDVVDVSQDRMFRTNIAAIVAHTIRAEALTVSQIVSEFIVVGMARLDRCSLENQLLGVVYILSGVLSCIDSDTMVNTASEDELQLFLWCFRKMVDLFHCKVKEGSIFALHPTSDLAQNEHMAILRSLMDGVGLSGTLKSLMRSSLSAEWSLLKAKVLQDLGTVIGWKPDGAYLDDRVAPKLVAVKKIAIENVGRVVSGLPGMMSADLSSGVEAVLDALFDLDVETDVELQFDVGEVLVALGTHDFEETFAVDRQAKYDVFAANRAATIFERVVNEHAESRQPKKRRIAAVWLLCMCAAGLTTSSRNDGRTVAYATSWAGVFRSPAYSRSILSVHEFFVTMLNDANEVAKECAVKGLAYLRLHSPTDEMGAHFSESLFRRLRCFRAFVSSSDVVDDADDGGQAVDHSREDGRSTAAILSSSSGSVIENAAYREVSNVAADVGDPELMYALLYLSTKDPIWESIATSNASRPMLRPGMFSFVTTDEKFRTSVIAKAGTQWMAEDYSSKTKLAPWLFLLKFHPHSKVAAVMSNLWEFVKGNSATIATATGEKALLRQHWPLFFQFTLARLENDRNFKYRVAACLALVDLLNGAEADDVRESFLRLWICASRAVDDVVEAVAVAGVKLYRYLGEVSLRIALRDTACSSLLVKFLVENGIVSKSSVCRALSIDILIRLVKTLKAHDIQDRLAPLLLKLLEYLSSLEMPELQYAQFHVEKKDQLERLRVSISQAGPVGQLLDLATVRLKELAGSTDCVTVVGELARGVANLLKFGVGLNTRVGTANFVITLAGELPFELRKCNGAELLLRRVLIPYVGMKTAGENDQYGDEESRYGGTSGIDGGDSSLAATSGLADGLVIQSYCRAAAYLCPLVDAGTVRDYVRRGIFACSTLGQSSSNISSSSAFPLRDDVEMEADETENVRLKSHQVFTSRFLLISALAMTELVKKVPPIADTGTVVIDDMRNTWYCTHVFPAAFIGQFAAANALKSSWKTVLDELPPTVLYASRSLDAVLQAIALLLAHPAWDTRRQAARALQAIFASATYCSKLSVEQVERIWCKLIDAVPGRLWRGKGVILASIVSLAAFKMETRATDMDEEWTNKLSLLLAEECARAWKNQDLAYLESAIINLGRLSALLPAEQSDLRRLNVCSLRSMLAEWMTGNAMESSESSWPALPPLLIKCVFEALSLMWPPLAAAQGTAGIKDVEISAETLLWLCASVESPHLAAWSVRRAIFQTLAAVADRAPLKALAGSNGVVERMVDSCCGSFGVADGKYSMVRVAAAGALVPLLKRAANTSNLALRLVVQRERMAAAVQTLSASEEASEQQAAFNLKSQLSLMP